MATRIAWGLLACLSLAGSADVWAQSSDQATQAPPKVETQPARKPTPEQLGVSFDRVKAALERELGPALRISSDQPTFRVEIIEKRKPFLPDFTEGLKIDWQPVTATGLYHDEFMSMVTPPQARPYGAFVNGELVQVALTSVLNSLLMSGARSLIDSGRDAWQARVEQAIREQVRREFEDFLKAHPEAPRPVR
jgi:hypothetical protein